MGHPILLLVLSLVLIPARTHEEGHISVILHDKGINFAKDLLIKKAVSSIIPLQLPDIERHVKIPIIGKVHVVLSKITIYSLDVPSSSVDSGGDIRGITLIASGATAHLTMNWKYSYKNWVVEISDSGAASVQVNDMEIWVTVTLKEEDGSIKLSMLDRGCHLKDISIKMDGGASWLYQVLVDAFEGPIGTAIQKAISNKIEKGILKLDSRLQSLPKQVSIDNVSAMNVAFVDDPLFSDSSVKLDIDGLFIAADNVLVPNYYYDRMQASDSLSCPSKMIALSLHENVFNSAAEVYFNAGYMHWTVERFPNQSLLNTATWRFLYPQLYKQYPDDDMSLKILLTSPPVVKITKEIDATIYLDVTVNVFDANEVIPVACVSLVISASGSPHISRNKLAGFLKLKHFTVSPKWSNIGGMHLIEPIAFAVVETEIIPYVNLRLVKGFQIPVLHRFILKNAEIHYSASKMMICSNIALT
ncbi:putative BPI/LBP family protein At1g04970 [Euphorbia lathyris]|uniref:putative BPI/LBP family protein At1g04970 n=1 Tax=Euphorbia lathyris TaxID=212925 RepID=UPI003313492F